MHLFITPETSTTGTEILHNHINCPVCGKLNVPTDCFVDMNLELAAEGKLTFGCRCGAQFKFVSGNPYDFHEGQWERVQV
jgi:hypothetical protein